MHKVLPVTFSGPYTHENLTIFLFHGSDLVDGRRYTSLKGALENEEILVHETGTVGQLEAENLSDKVDIFIQAGDVLKGGRQDRAIGIDFIVPAKSGRVQVPAFCVESGRWQKRSSEDAAFFSTSNHAMHAKSMRLAAKIAQDQGAVWQSVNESQESLGSALNKSVHSPSSPTSYQLTVEDVDLKKRKEQHAKKLHRIASERDDTLGYAFYVNGDRNSADLYASKDLFHSLWDKLLDVAILEAISAQKKEEVPAPDKADAGAWLKEAAKAKPRTTRDAPPRTHVATKTYKSGVVFETLDEAAGKGIVLHTNIISN